MTAPDPQPGRALALRRLEHLAATLRADRGIDLSAEELAELLESSRLRAQAAGDMEEAES